MTHWLGQLEAEQRQLG